MRKILSFSEYREKAVQPAFEEKLYKKLLKYKIDFFNTLYFGYLVLSGPIRRAG